MPAEATFNPGDVHPDQASHHWYIHELGKVRGGLAALVDLRANASKIPPEHREAILEIGGTIAPAFDAKAALTRLDKHMDELFREYDAKRTALAKAKEQEAAAQAEPDDADTARLEDDGGKPTEA